MGLLSRVQCGLGVLTLGLGSQVDSDPDLEQMPEAEKPAALAKPGMLTFHTGTQEGGNL